MKYLFAFFFLSFLILLNSCNEKNNKELSQGMWLGELEVTKEQKLPFNFMLEKSSLGAYSMAVYNDEETIVINEIAISGDSIVIKMPVFESYFSGNFTENSIKGRFINESLGRNVAFEATFGIKERFDKTGKPSPGQNISGDWEVVFGPGTIDSTMAKGIFKQRGDQVTGTFRTTTGDYRFLQGIQYGDSVRLSAFDGAHAYLFAAKVTDSTLNGMFYSGNHFKEPFTAQRNENFELPSEDSLTFLKEGYEKLNFAFPNTDDQIVSLEDDNFKDKVVVVQVMGTWCPNCLDESMFLVDFMEEYQEEPLEVVALAFEYAKSKEMAFKAINRLKERLGVKYPVLLAQYGSSNKNLAQDKLPMLNHILSYPTTIIIDKSGQVRKIYTGFNGPATGEVYEKFKTDFHGLIGQLLEE
ncbi:TlpA family protein disulfide reductase [Arenibacter sp. 6A1]|uniref:peroxiredoxin family protein n=1 Tax=Arenibacter sp. 6A1 TaxID=2720391 RepID=UPI0014461277|nr:TlpA disulfide reductase family protein [Arenibacter sp. 6A1]NKI25906.1 TlpA family protein disulfide reductase [Arenibacter sp. 6A1]